MITKRQYIIISYFLTRVLFFGVGISLLLALGSNNTFIGYLLGSILGLFSFKFLVNKRMNNKLLLYGLCFILISYILTGSTVMMHSFFLIKTPPIIIILLIMLVIFYSYKKDKSVIFRVGEILFPISIIVIIFKSISYGIYGLSSVSNILPLFYSNIPNFILCVIVSYLYSFIPNILLLYFDIKIDFKDMIKGYIIGCITILSTIVIIELIFGFPLASIIRYPEYMVLKKISLFKYINNLENILTITWQFDAAISCLIISNIIKDISNNKIIFTVFMLLVVLSVIQFNKVYNNALILYKYTYIVIGILGFLLIKKTNKS